MKRKTLWTDLLFAALVLAGMMLFFILIHPIPIVDEDDVIYSVMIRKAVPIPGSWNPSRLLPEVLAACCGHLAALLTRLGCGHFIHCQVFVTGTVLSLFITAYILMFRRLLRRRFDLGQFPSCCLSLLFLELHFLVYRTAPEGNMHMFHSYNACCMFFYVIPALLCASLTMALMAEDHDSPLEGKSIAGKSLWVTAVYFAVFSNLYGSVLLGVWAGLRILKSLLQRRNAMEKKPFFRNIAFPGTVLLLWLAALILEATGGRAKNVSTLTNRKGSLGTMLEDSAELFFRNAGRTSLLFRLMLIAAAAALIILLVSSARKKETHGATGLITDTLCMGVLCSVFLILLNAVVSPDYMDRTEVIFIPMFTVILFMVLCYAAFLRLAPQTAALLPIALVFVLSMTVTKQRTFADSISVGIQAQAAVRLEDEIYQSIITAAEDGKEYTGVRVPKYNESGNWPHDGNIGQPIADLFVKYGIIDHAMDVWTEPTEELNARYGIEP